MFLLVLMLVMVLLLLFLEVLLLFPLVLLLLLLLRIVVIHIQKLVVEIVVIVGIKVLWADVGEVFWSFRTAWLPCSFRLLPWRRVVYTRMSGVVEAVEWRQGFTVNGPNG